ncbi:MAG: hypothetical protein SGARI_000253 [Bacillariaceae sp.]
MTTDTEPLFPFETRVILHDLKTTELNGKLGVIRRYSVFIKEENKTVGLKPANLQYEPRTVDSLSAKELKMVLKGKDVEDSEYTGIDKAELKSKVSELVPNEDDIPKLLAKGMSAAPKPAPAKPAKAPARQTPNQAAQAADQLSKMSPDQLRQQAQMMRSMPPSQLRRMNPQFARMNDTQIKQAADQMEMMANNPQMMEMMANQVKNMDPDELERIQSQARNGQMPAGMPPPGSGAPPRAGGQQQQPGEQDPTAMLQNMDKEQFKTMMKMVKDNPDMLKQYAAMSGTTEEQLKQFIDAFSGMSDDKMEAALKVMKTAASAKEKWTQVNEKTGGHLKTILVSGTVLFVGLIVWYFFFRTSAAATITPNNVVGDIPNIAKENAIVEEEYESEF